MRGDHIVAGRISLELRGFRLWNLTTAQRNANSIPAAVSGETQPQSNLGSSLDATNAGLLAFDATTGRPLYHNGGSGTSGWVDFSSPAVSGDVYGSFPLDNNHIMVGNGSNLAQMFAKSEVPISDWGAGAASVDLGGFRLLGMADPTGEFDGANKRYVDTVAAGVNPKEPVDLATDEALPSCTYNGAAGTLTATANGTLTSTIIDAGGSAVTLVAGAEGVGTRVLVKDQSTQIQNGIYRVSTLGSGGTQWVLTRTADANENAELAGATTRALSGTSSGIIFRQSRPLSDYNISAGTGTLVWVNYLEVPSFTAGNGIDITGSTISFLTHNSAGSVPLTTSDSGQRNILFQEGTQVRRVANPTSASATNRNILLGYTGGAHSWSAWTVQDPAGAGHTAGGSYLMRLNRATSVLERVPHSTGNFFYTQTTGGHVEVVSGANLPWVPQFNGQLPVLANAIIPLNRGGTGADNSSGTVAVGSVMFKNGASTAGFTESTPSLDTIPMIVSSGILDMVNIFTRSNLWTNANVFQSVAADGTGSAAIYKSSTLPGIGASSGSSTIQFESKTGEDGTPLYHFFRVWSNGRGLRIDSSYDNALGATGTYAQSVEFTRVTGTGAGPAIRIGSITLIGTTGNSGQYGFPNTGVTTGLTVAVDGHPNVFTEPQTIVDTASALLVKLDTAHTQPSFAIRNTGGAGIHAGPGSSTATDVSLIRTGVGTWSMTGSLYFGVTNHITSDGIWRGAIIERARGGFGRNVDTDFANGDMFAKLGGVVGPLTGTKATGRIPRMSSSSAVAWSTFVFADPGTFAQGDIIRASAANTLSALALPVGATTDSHILSLSGSPMLPNWRRLIAVRGTGAGGASADVGMLRVWKTLYQGTGSGTRDVTITHALNTRQVHKVTLRETNSGDTLNPSQVVETRWDVISASQVKVWFPAVPTNSEYYEISISA